MRRPTVPSPPEGRPSRSPGRQLLRAAALAAAALAAGPPVASAAAAPAVTLRGGEPAAATTVCGEHVTPQRVAVGGALRVDIAPASSAHARRERRRAGMLVERCVDGSWRRERTVRLGARRGPLLTRISTAVDGDLRVRTRLADGTLGAPSHVRVGVGEIVDVPVTLEVVNRNRTAIPCLGAPDGSRYRIHGSVVAPRAVLDAPRPAITVYVHGLGYASWFFRFGDVPGYDYGLQQAQAGHASLVLDRLGNPAHDELPDGSATCIPAQADMVDQVIGALRRGAVPGVPGAPRFSRVLLAGHSLGGFITQVAQYSFGSADAIAVIGYTDVPSVLALGQFADAGAQCLTAPQRSRGGSGAPNYAAFGRTDADFAAAHFHDLDPTVRRIALQRHNRDPCGDLLSALQALAVDQLGTRLGITSPVLVISGADDALFTPPTNRLQAATAYPRSPDVQLVELPRTGHAVTLGRSHEAFRAAMDRWLAKHGG